MSDLTDDFVEWVREQLKAHKAEVTTELDSLEAKKSLSISIKLKLKNIGGVFKPSYHFSIPRAAVEADFESDKQLQPTNVNTYSEKIRDLAIKRQVIEREARLFEHAKA